MTATQETESNDILAYLKAVPITKPERGQVLYENATPKSVYLVVSGRFKVLREIAGTPVIVDFYGPDSLFGALPFTPSAGPETVIAMDDDCAFMDWTRQEVQVRLGECGVNGMLAMMEHVSARMIATEKRLVSTLVSAIKDRIIDALLDHGERFGAEASGHVALPAITHEVIGQYIGTSREVVTAYMNSFRRSGAIQFSRKGVVIQPAELLKLRKK